jgi:hypothetical protein
MTNDGATATDTWPPQQRAVAEQLLAGDLADNLVSALKPNGGMYSVTCGWGYMDVSRNDGPDGSYTVVAIPRPALTFTTDAGPQQPVFLHFCGCQADVTVWPGTHVDVLQAATIAIMKALQSLRQTQDAIKAMRLYDN